MIDLYLVPPETELEMLEKYSPLSVSNSMESITQLVQSTQVPLPCTMVTRSQRGIVKPNQKYVLTSLKISAMIPFEHHNIRLP